SDPFTVTVPSRDRRTMRPDDTAAASPPAPATRQFPAGTFIVRMDQPYSRIADALLDHEYWSPHDPQKTPYDDTGWSFPELFGVDVVRVTDPRVLSVGVTPVTDTALRTPAGVSGTGPVAVINATGENRVATLRYRLRTADMQVAEAPFTADGHPFSRGSILVRGVPAADLNRALSELGLVATAVALPAGVPTHPARAPRIALLHTWTGTQTEGWWRQAFDRLQIPYDYISVQDVARIADLN